MLGSGKVGVRAYCSVLLSSKGGAEEEPGAGEESVSSPSVKGAATGAD